MAITIPPVPEGIENPNNLYNDVYSNLKPLRWDNPEFHDKLAWILEKGGGVVTGWYAPRASFGTSAIIASTFARVQLAGDIVQDVDVLNIIGTPTSAVVLLNERRTGQPQMQQIAPYPGYEVRHPATASPIGEKFTLGQRTLFKCAPGDVAAEGATWQAPDGTYRKIRVQIRPGAGPFGVGGVYEPAWEKVWDRA